MPAVQTDNVKLLWGRINAACNSPMLKTQDAVIDVMNHLAVCYTQ